MSRKKREGDLSRRGFLKGVGAAVGGAAAGLDLQGSQQGPPALGPGKVVVTLHVNGVAREAEIEPRVTLLNVLRNHLDVTGPKPVCDRGACGGCSVLVDGVLVNSCMMLALDASGSRITTVEGLAEGEKLHPIQEAFCAHDALQCGFCTPGMIMACKALLDRNPSPTNRDTREALAGNLCRCGTYPRIFEAVQTAAKAK